MTKPANNEPLYSLHYTFNQKLRASKVYKQHIRPISRTCNFRKLYSSLSNDPKLKCCILDNLAGFVKLNFNRETRCILIISQ